MIDNKLRWGEEHVDVQAILEVGDFPALRTARRPRVVVAEDSKELRDALLRHMRREHYLVFVAADGLEALDAVRCVEPDVLLLDLGLPRLHGLKLLHALRMESIDVPVVVLTGDTSPVSWERAIREGVRRLLLKPTPTREVLKAIREVLEEE